MTPPRIMKIYAAEMGLLRGDGELARTGVPLVSPDNELAIVELGSYGELHFRTLTPTGELVTSFTSARCGGLIPFDGDPDAVPAQVLHLDLSTGEVAFEGECGRAAWASRTMLLDDAAKPFEASWTRHPDDEMRLLEAAEDCPIVERFNELAAARAGR